MKEIESWWRHNGAYDREQATGIPYDGNLQEYLDRTDKWWNSLTDEMKTKVYIDFFAEY